MHLTRSQRWTIIVVAILLITGFSGSFVRISRDVVALESAVNATREAVAVLSEAPLDGPNEDLLSLGDRITEAQDALLDLRRDVGPFLPLAPLFGFMPRYGGDIREAEKMLEYGIALSQVARATYEGALPIVEASASGFEGRDSLDVLLTGFETSAPIFEEAQGQLQSALELRGQINDVKLSHRTEQALDSADDFSVSLEGILSFGVRAPDALRSFGAAYDSSTVLTTLLAASSVEGGLDRSSLNPVADRLSEVKNQSKQALARWESGSSKTGNVQVAGLGEEDIEALLLMIFNSAEAGEAALRGAHDVLAFVDESALGAADGSLDGLLQSLDQAHPAFLRASLALDTAEEARSRLGPQIERYAPLESFDEGTRDLRVLVTFGANSPDLLRTVVRLRQEVADINEGLNPDALLLQGASDQLELYHQSIQRMKAHLRTLRSIWEPMASSAPVLQRFKLMDASDVETLLDASEALVDALEGSLEAFAMITDAPAESGLFNEAFGRRVDVALSAQREARSRASRALDIIGRVDDGDAGEYVFSMSDVLIRETPALRAVLERSEVAEEALATLLGLEGPRRYLLIAQDEDERKGSGGYFPAAWEVTLDRGVLTLDSFVNTWAVDAPDYGGIIPPKEFVEYFFGGAIPFRDAGWYPDWPASAELALTLYERGTGERFDGAIAVNKRAMQDLVSVIGPVEVSSVDAPVTGENVIDLLNAGQATGVGPDTIVQGGGREFRLPNRLFFQELGQALFVAFKSPQDSENGDLIADTVRTLFRGKHSMVYSRDSNVAALLARAGWDGGMRPASYDYLMVTGALMQSGKTDRILERQVSYRVQLGEQPTAELTLDYMNPSRLLPWENLVDWVPCDQWLLHAGPDNCYFEFARIYTPAGITLLEHTELLLPEGSAIHRAWGNPLDDTVHMITEDFDGAADKGTIAAFFDIPFEAERTASFSYLLPGQVLEKDSSNATYRLLVQKQPGVRPSEFSLEVFFPEEWRLEDVIVDGIPPGKFSFEAGHFVLRDTLSNDLSVTLRFDLVESQ